MIETDITTLEPYWRVYVSVLSRFQIKTSLL